MVILAAKDRSTLVLQTPGYKYKLDKFWMSEKEQAVTLAQFITRIFHASLEEQLCLGPRKV